MDNQRVSRERNFFGKRSIVHCAHQAISVITSFGEVINMDSRKVNSSAMSLNTKIRLIDHKRKLSRMYGTHLIKEWISSYIQIGNLEKMLQLASQGAQSLPNFENELEAEVRRVNEFIEKQVKVVRMDIDAVAHKWSRLDSVEHSKILGNSQNQALMRTIQSYYKRIEDILKFYRLNSYIVAKLRVEFDRLGSKDRVLKSIVFDFGIGDREEEIVQLQKRCTDVYASIFHFSAPGLAFGDLHFTPEEESEFTSIKIGCKLGLIFGLVSQKRPKMSLLSLAY